VSYRYAILTQILAKTTEPSINALCLQAKAKDPGAFDARSFCKKTIVVFEEDKLGNALGGSKDPYVSKPLRHDVISPKLQDIKDVSGWIDLYKILKRIEDANNADFTSRILRQTLLEVYKLRHEVLKPPLSIPTINIGQLKAVLISYLAKPSQGARPQAIIYALLKTLNERVKAFDIIDTAKATTANGFAGRLADIECKDSSNNLKLAVAVTDELNATKLKDELDKALKNNIRNLIVIAHNIREKSRIDEVVDRYRYDLDVVVMSLIEFVSVVTILWNSELRRRFALKAYDVLHELAYHEHAVAWDRILRKNLNLDA